MEYVRLGSTGLKVSRICLGCMSYGQPGGRWAWALPTKTKAGHFSSKPSNWGSTSSTPPTSIRAG